MDTASFPTCIRRQCLRNVFSFFVLAVNHKSFCIQCVHVERTVVVLENRTKFITYLKQWYTSNFLQKSRLYFSRVNITARVSAALGAVKSKPCSFIECDDKDDHAWHGCLSCGRWQFLCRNLPGSFRWLVWPTPLPDLWTCADDPEICWAAALI